MVTDSQAGVCRIGSDPVHETFASPSYLFHIRLRPLRQPGGGDQDWVSRLGPSKARNQELMMRLLTALSVLPITKGVFAFYQDCCQTQSIHTLRSCREP